MFIHSPSILTLQVVVTETLWVQECRSLLRCCRYIHIRVVCYEPSNNWWTQFIRCQCHALQLQSLKMCDLNDWTQYTLFTSISIFRTMDLLVIISFTRKPYCCKETARFRSYSGRFSLPCCCISFSSSYEYHVDFSTLPNRCVVFLVTYMLFEMHQNGHSAASDFGEKANAKCCEM